MKVLYYVQYLQGIGHVRRASLLAESLAAAGAEVTVAFGGFPVAFMAFPGAEVIQLPPARAGDVAFKTVLDDSGHPIDDAWRDARARQLLGIYRETRPDVLIVETYPFGRGKFHFELEPLLEMARAGGRTLIASSVRDILVAKNKPRQESEMADRARRWFDLVLVHGDANLIPLDATFPFVDRVADLVRYTGYIVPDQPAVEASGDGIGEVIVSAGGGALGDPLLRSALAARPKSPLADLPWRFLLGPESPPETIAYLRIAAGNGVIVEPARPDFPALLHRCHLSISLAGYNTVMDVLRARCQSVLVPSTAGGETEQTIRARLLAERGVVQMAEDSTLTVEALAKAITDAVSQTPVRLPDIDMDGRDTSVRLIFEAVGQRSVSQRGH